MTPRTRLALAFALLVLVWPVAHMTLTKTTGLNSWKLGGWGMYATVHPMEHGLVLLPYDQAPPRPDDLGPVLDEIRVLLPTDGSDLREIEVEEIPPETQRSLFDHATDLLALGQDGHVRAYVRPLEEAAAGTGAPARRSLLLVTEGRLDLLGDSRTWVRAKVYRHDGGEVTRIGTFDSDEMSVGELLAELARRSRPPGSAG